MSVDVYQRYEIPDDWEWIKLGEICSVRDRDHRTPNYVDAGVPLISPRDFEENGINFTRMKTVHLDELVTFKKKCDPQKGDILYSRIGTIGEARLLNFDFEFVALHSIALIKPLIEELDSKYLLYLMQTQDVRSQARHNVKSVGTPDLGLKRIKDFEVPIAPLEQQKRIVAEIEKQFSRLDEAVANLKRVKTNLKRYKAAVLKAAVEGKLTEEWRKQHPDVEPADKLLERILVERREKWQGRGKYKESAAPDTIDLPELPEGWVWVTLPQLGELNRGKSKHRPRNDSKLFGGDSPFVQTGDVRHAVGEIKSYTQTYSEAGLAQSRLWPKGTLCITIAANIADTALLGFDACFPDSVVGFLPETDHTNIRFVEYFIRTAKENLERFAPATAQKNINLQILKAVAVPFPSESEQNAIVFEIESRLSVVEKIESALNFEIARSDRLRQSILKKAFSGQLV